jgi:hypothetical protein
MEEPVIQAIKDAFVAAYHEMHESYREHVRGMDHGTLNWSPLPKANSIAVLVTHAITSEREMMHGVRNEVIPRDRESEFRAEADSEQLLALIDTADREVDELVTAIVATDLTDLRPRGNFPPRPGIYWLVTNYGHAREHLAQMMLTKQLYDSRT